MKKWAYLATAPNQLTAEMWRDLLQDQGVTAIIRPGDTMTFYLGVGTSPCRLMVREDQHGQAKEILEGHLEHDVA